MILLNGKQLDNSTINQNNMSIDTNTILSGTSVTNKEYVIQQINDKSGSVHQSRLNQHMTARVATVGDKACDKAVIEFPISTILVSINGSLVNVGSGLDCYFSPDGITIRTNGNGQKGDFLYWNSSNYDLDTSDEIDFNYLIGYDYVSLSGGTTVTLDPFYNSFVVRYTGDDASTMNVIIDGVTIVVGNVSNQFVWDIGGVAYTFTEVGESYVAIINGNNYTIWFDGFGSLIYSVKLGGEILFDPIFKMEIQTSGASQSVTLPHTSGYVYNYTVDYGDNTGLKTVTSYNDTDCTHVYATAGTYQIKISGTCQTFYVNNAGTLRLTIKKILSWGNIDLRIVSFWGCSNLTSLPSYGKGLTNVVNFNSIFASCTSLTSIPTDIFKFATGITSYGFASAFYGCTSLTSIPTDLFRYNTLVSTYGFYQTFRDCTNLTSLPDDLFRYNTLVSSNGFYITFYNCTSLTSIPTDLFRYNTLVSTDGFYSTFYGCISLTSIPIDIFKFATGVTSNGFHSTFGGCVSLISIPTDLFRYNTLVSTSGFLGTFLGCTNLISIPTDLFRYNILVSTSGFQNTFYGCTSLTSLPDDLFRYNTLVSSSGFYWTFFGCTSLTSIPTDLFRYNTLVSTSGFYGTFYGCTSLTSIPTDLFRYNTLCNSFYQTFYNCNKLQLNSTIFYQDGGQTTRFLNRSVDFTQCFNRNGFSGVQGIAPDLWNCSFGIGTPTKTTCFGGVGNHLTSLTNYPFIPTAWGGATGLDSTFQLQISATTAGQTIVMPHLSGYSHIYTVDYGDSTGLKTVTGYTDTNCTHTYTNAGVYTIKLTGTCETFYINNDGNLKSLITKVLQWGDKGFKQLNFNGCNNLNSISSVSQGLYSVTNFENTFLNCTSLTSIPTDLFRYNSLSTSYINTFSGCTGLVGYTPDLWNTKLGVSGTSCFSGCSGLTNYSYIPIDWGGLGQSSQKFIIEIETISASQSVTLPHTSGYVYNYVVDYGDGTSPIPITTYNGTGCTHVYTTIGIYTITISGTCETFYVNNTGTMMPRIRKVLNWGNIGLKVVSFYGCTNLNSIVTDSNSGLTSVVNFQNTFNSTQITSIPTDIFRYATGVTSNGFNHTFAYCTSLISIPIDLFRYNTLVSTYGFYRTFYYCSSLETVQEGLFRYNTLVSTYGFKETFYQCTSLTSIPTDLFRYNVDVSSGAFSSTFLNCTSLTSIPTDLFRYNVNVSTAGFQGTFSNCRSLTSIPTDLFRYNTLVSTNGFYQTFQSCTNLQTVPEGLFKYNTDVTIQGFYQTFMGCNNLQLNPWIFYASGETGTRFLNKVSDFTQCFYRTSTGVTASGGTAPDLWNCNFGSQTPVKTNCFTGNNQNTLTNYSSIPLDWGGTYVVDATALKLEITTTSTNQSIIIPHTSGYVYNYAVDYGDGSIGGLVTTYNGSDTTHTYATPGTYTMRIGGTCETIYVNNGGTLILRIKKVLSWGNVGLKVVNFYGCTNLNSIVTDSNNGLSGVTQYQSTFRGCTSLSSIPSDLFRYGINVLNFSSAFNGCTSLTSIPTDLFKYNTGVINDAFLSTFANCTSLTSIPTDLFRYNINATSYAFFSTFNGCTSLTSIPTDLFRYNTLISSYSFANTFQNCTSLTSIPTDLFRYNTLVSTSGFQSTFSGCTSLTSIPTDLFRYNTLVSTSGFYQTFYNCTSLITIPNYIFKYNTNVTTTGFFQTFMNCTNLQLNPWIFYASGETGTRFLNKASDFTQCFYRTSSGLTSSGGTAPELWNCNFGTQTPVKTNCFNGIGNSTTNLTNYIIIPNIWGGRYMNDETSLKLQITTSSTNQSVTIPHTSGYVYNYVIDYGDGTSRGYVNSYNGSDTTHTYATPGTYTMRIGGICETIYVNNSAFVNVLRKILSWGNVGLKLSQFYGCLYLNSIVTDSTSGLTNVINFTDSFYNCNNLSSIPSDLFKYATGATSFYRTFYGCPISSIPTDLFRYNTLTTSFYGTFYSCTNLMSIPSDLFRYNTEVTSGGFQWVFYNCASISTIPDYLFRYNTKCYTFYRVFQLCPKLQVTPWVFYADGEQSTRFSGMTMDFTECFLCTASYSGVIGTAPDLWNCTYSSVTSTSCFSGYSALRLTNYAIIPDGWKN